VQLEIKRRKIREDQQARDEVAAAIVVQSAWRKKGERDMLMGRFGKRRELLERKIRQQHENEYVGERAKRNLTRSEATSIMLRCFAPLAFLDSLLLHSSLRSSLFAQRTVIVRISNSLQQQQQVRHGDPALLLALLRQECAEEAGC